MATCDEFPHIDPAPDAHKGPHLTSTPPASLRPSQLALRHCKWRGGWNDFGRLRMLGVLVYVHGGKGLYLGVYPDDALMHRAADRVDLTGIGIVGLLHHVVEQREGGRLQQLRVRH